MIKHPALPLTATTPTHRKMYIPHVNLMSDKNEAVEFMKRFSFATIITVNNERPVATHLPFLISLKNDQIILTSHFAKANEQWKDMANHQALVIFTEPHAYISPTHYDKETNVPTWNYISIHAYGRGELVTESEEVFEILERTIDNYESSYKQQWDRLPEEFRSRLSKGIVAFHITVTELQARKKLSQNKNEHEQARIIETLSKSKNTNENLIADYMKQNLRK